MPSRKLSLRLYPQGRAYSRLSLSGVIPTTPSAQDLRLFCCLLSLWQGSPLDVVLSAGARASWVTAWSDALAFVHEAHLRVRFVLDGGDHDR